MTNTANLPDKIWVLKLPNGNIEAFYEKPQGLCHAFEYAQVLTAREHTGGNDA